MLKLGTTKLQTFDNI